MSVAPDCTAQQTGSAAACWRPLGRRKDVFRLKTALEQRCARPKRGPSSLPAVLRSVCAITLSLASLAVCGAARADADPASDVLYTEDVFLPLSTKVSPELAQELADATRAASEAGNPIRVALIAAPAELGGVPTLFGKPVDYARFLDAELQFVYTGRLLVVMPQGAALAAQGRLEANAAVVHAAVESGGDGMVRTAIALVRELSDQAPKPPSTSPSAVPTITLSPTAPSPAVSTATSAKGFPVWLSAGIAVGAVCLLLLGGLILVRRRQRVRQLEGGRGSDVVPDRDDPYRYKGP
jgi:hypothetical protein